MVKARISPEMNSDGTQPSPVAHREALRKIRPDWVESLKRPRSRIIVLGCLIISILIGILFVLVLPISAYAYYQVNGLIVPGVSVGDLEVGGLSLGAAKTGLEQVYGQDFEIVVSDRSRAWIAKASDFGVRWDIDAMAQVAINVAHGKDFSTEMSEMFESVLNGWRLEPIFAFDVEAARAELLKWEATVNIPAKNAELHLNGAELETIPAETGLSLDVEETLSHLVSDPKALIEKGELWFVVASQEPQITDVSQSRAEIEEYLHSEVVVYAYDPLIDENYSWEIGKEILASWLVLQQAEDGPEAIIDAEKVRVYAEEINASLESDQYLEVEEIVSAILGSLDGEPDVILRVYHPPTNYLVQEDDTLLEIGWELGFPYWMIQDANPYLYSSPLEYGKEIVIPSKDELMPLPVVPSKRIVISISEQRLRAYQDGEVLYEFIISTGIEDSPTQPGVYQVRTHELNAYASRWDLYMPHFMGVYEAWPEFMNGIHGLPMLSSGRRLWANVLGRPASYGCIILTLEDAETLYYWAEDGVVVEILR